MDSDCEGRFGFGGKCGNSLLRKKVRKRGSKLKTFNQNCSKLFEIE
jgi:hypothetical protein